MPLVTNGSGPFVQFNFELEYQKGCDNTVVDLLSWVTTRLDPDMARSILGRVALGAAHQAKVQDPAIVKHDCSLEQEVCVAAGCTLVQLHDDWFGWSPKGGPNVECIFRLAEGTEEDRYEGTSGRTCLQWGRSTDPKKSTEFYD